LLNYLRNNETLIILSLNSMFMMMGAGLIGPILPLFAREFGLNITMIGVVIAMFAAARTIMDIPAGRISDIFGRRSTLIAGPLVLAAGSIGCGLATNAWQLIIFRILQGAGSGLFTIAGIVMLADISTVANRGSNMSIFQGCLWAGVGLGPLLGGFIGQYIGLRAVFYAYAIIALLSALWTFIRLPETKSSCTSVHSALKEQSEHNSSLLKHVKNLLLNFNFVLICIVSLSLFMLNSGCRNQILPLIANERLGLSASEIGIALSVLMGTNVLFIFISGKISDMIGRKPLITPGLILVAAGTLLITFSQSYWLLILSCVLMGSGIGFAGSISGAYVADMLTNENQSMGLSIFRALSDVGLMIGPILLGWLSDIEGYEFSLYISAVILVTVALVFQIFAREHPTFTRKA